jgi:hypothetical protein
MGDSWACGEWGLTDPADPSSEFLNHHPGISRYLRDQGHSVQVLAQGGHGNHKQTLQAQEHGVQGQIIWFITDPLRDLGPGDYVAETGSNEPWRSLHERVQTVADYHRERDQLLRVSLARMRDHRIWLVGGNCRIPDWVNGEFPDYRIITADLTEWLLGHPGPDAFCRQWMYYDCSADLVDLYHHQERDLRSHLSRARQDTTSPEHQWFWPDGQHPNRQAHLRLTTELIVPLSGTV